MRRKDPRLELVVWRRPSDRKEHGEEGDSQPAQGAGLSRSWAVVLGGRLERLSCRQSW